MRRLHALFGFTVAFLMVFLPLLFIAAPEAAGATPGTGGDQATLSQGTPPAGAGGFRDLFVQGNAFYDQGNYEAAIDQYSNLVRAGVVDKDLFYNLANSYYKLDDFGRAVLYFERARRLAPRDDDVRENLALVRTQLKDKQFVHEHNRIVGALAWLHNNLSAREMTRVASLCYLVLCFLGVIFVLRDSPRVAAAYRWFSYLSPGRLLGLNRSQDIGAAIVIVSLLFLSTGVSAFRKAGQESQHRTAVVLQEEVPVYSGPAEETTLQFKIHKGTLVRVRDERKSWIRINLPGGLSGWVSALVVERV